MWKSNLKPAALLILLFASKSSIACMCMDFRSLEKRIPEYDFIAHVRIQNKIVRHDTIERGKDYYRIRTAHEGKLKIDILELFKGPVIDTIIEYDIMSSCEIGIDKEEEWVLFAKYDSVEKQYSVGGCTPSSVYRNRLGERFWYSFFADSKIEGLKKYFGHSEIQYSNGKHFSYYKNGQIEWEATFLDKEFDGKRMIYYANSRTNYEQYYKNGKADSIHRHFSRTGQLLTTEEYQLGKLIWSKEWADTTNKYQFRENLKQQLKDIKVSIQLIEEYMYKDSTYSCNKYYYITGELKQEIISNKAAQLLTIHQYYKSGKMKYTSVKDFSTGKNTYKKWDEKGRLEADAVTINDKIVEDNLKKKAK